MATFQIRALSRHDIYPVAVFETMKAVAVLAGVCAAINPFTGKTLQKIETQVRVFLNRVLLLGTSDRFSCCLGACDCL